MGYAQGDVVVHPQHGTAVVKGVVTKDLGQGSTEYLELYVDVASLRISVPAASVGQVGLRSLSSKKDAEAILELLGHDSDVPIAWADRNASTVARMKSRQLDQVAMVVRDLTRHQQRIDKPLNAGEHAALTTCLNWLTRELALSLDLPEPDMMALLAHRAAGPRGGAS